MSRRAWLLALWLYAIAAMGDAALHLREDVAAGEDWRDINQLAVAISAGLFWPADLAARALLSR